MAVEVSRRRSLSDCQRPIFWDPRSHFSTFCLGILFITLAYCRIFLIKFSIRDGHYNYLPVTVNVMAELLKFLACGFLSVYVLLIKETRTIKEIFSEIRWLQLLKWAVPGLLYFVDNLLGFYILAHLPPAIYSLLGNFVIISTAVLFRIVLRRKLSRVQWAALMILFLSIMALSHQHHQGGQHHPHRIIHHRSQSSGDGRGSSMGDVCRRVTADTVNATQVTEPSRLADQETEQDVNMFWGFKISTGCLLALLQCLLSSSANIYNEKIFKEDTGLEESIYVQNAKLYMFGIIFNSVTLLVRSEFRSHILRCGFFYGYNIHASLLIICTAAFGLTVALILKFRDNMFQVMSVQLANVIVITLSVLFFNFSPTLDFFLMAPIVLLAIFVYHCTRRKEDNGEVKSQYEVVPTDNIDHCREP